MSPSVLNQGTKAEAAEASWKSLYKAGGVAALLAIVALLVDIIISLGGEDFNPAMLGAMEWFDLFHGNGLSGLRALGLINIISLTIAISLYFALYAAHRQRYQAYAALASIVYLVGTAIYISNNAAVPMYVLSAKYAAATTEAQRTLLAAAGEAILARGADFAPGSFTGFFFTEMAGLAFSVLMLRSRIFSKANAYLGILGFMALAIFTIWTTFVPVFFEAAMILAMVGGLSSVGWYILVARRLFQLGQGVPETVANHKALVTAR